MSLNKALPDEIVSVLETVLQKTEKPIALHEPYFGGQEWEYIKDCLDSGYVSSVGTYVNKFEHALATFTGSKYAACVVNGTAALQICLMLAGVGQGDEVLTPALSFIATANAVCYLNAIPHFVDSEMLSLGVDGEKLDEYLKNIAELRDGVCYNKRTDRPIRALIVMHSFGHPVDLEPILKLCSAYGLELIEDAAESLGSYYKNVHTGKFGKLAAVSFNGNKIVTTGGGGAILTDDEDLFMRAKHITTTAKLPHRWAFVHDEVGFNYRMPNINAALGCAQLEQIEEFLLLKRALSDEYRKAFEGMPEISFFTEPPYAKSNYWLNTIVLSQENAQLRDGILDATNQKGLQTRPVWTLMSRLPMFQGCPRMDLTTAEGLEQRIINIPSSARLGEPYARFVPE